MKPILTLAVTVLAFSSLFAQAPLTHDDSAVLAEAGALPRVADFPTVIDAVLQDFPNNLRHISGELVMAQGEFENYASVLTLPDAQECIVTRWHSKRDTTASWQAKMFTSDDYSAAEKRYHRLYLQLKGCHMTLADSSLILLEGNWEPAREGVAFTTSTLRLKTDDWRYREVKIDVELVYQLADWAVQINIVSKRPDDEVGGEVSSLIRRLYCAPIHLDGRSRDIAGQRARQESDERRQLFRFADATQWNVFDALGHDVFEGRGIGAGGGHRSF